MLYQLIFFISAHLAQEMPTPIYVRGYIYTCDFIGSEFQTYSFVAQMVDALISLKRDKNISNFLVRSSFQTGDQRGTFKCARSRCTTCPFIHNAEKNYTAPGRCSFEYH